MLTIKEFSYFIQTKKKKTQIGDEYFVAHIEKLLVKGDSANLPKKTFRGRTEVEAKFKAELYAEGFIEGRYDHLLHLKF